MPLGAAEGAAFQKTADLEGSADILTWGPDLRLDAGSVHGRGEMAVQSLQGLLRGGGQLTASLDLDGLLRRLGAPRGWTRADLYAKWEQAWSDFGDSIHLAHSLYRATTYGLGLPLGWTPLSLKLEFLDVSNDAYGGILPDGRIAQAQLQIQL